MRIPQANLILTLVLMLCGSSKLLAQKYLFEAQHFTTEDGLSDFKITDVAKDEQGFLWAATKYGLNRYNGYTFELYNEKKNGLSFPKNIQQIRKDEAGLFWLLYSNTRSTNYPFNRGVKGIDIFNPETGVSLPLDFYFSQKIPFKITDVILSKIIDPKNRLWITTNKGQLFLYQDGRFKKIFEEKNTFFQYVTIDESDNIYLGWDKTIIQINIKGAILKKTPLPQQINGIWTGEQRQLWLATGIWKDTSDKKRDHNYTLKLWSKSKDGKLTPFKLSENNPKIKLEPQNGSFIHRSNRGYWYIKIAGQIHLFNEHGDFLFNYHTLIGDDLSTHFNGYHEDKFNMWLASPIGLIKTKVTENPFKLIHKSGVYSDCRSITEDELGNIYFRNKDLYQWNRQTHALKNLNSNGYYSLLYLDSLIFSGQYSTNIFASQLDLRTNQRTEYLVQDLKLPYCALPTKNPHQLFIGCSKGLCIIDTHQKKQLPFSAYNGFDKLKESKVYFFHKNSSGIWLATNNGVFLMREDEGIVRHFDKASGHLPFDHIRHIHEDMEGIFWLSTAGGGLIQWRPGKAPDQISISKQLTTQHGLSNNSTYAVYGDDFNNLWISSDKGLMCLNKKSLQIKTYLKEDGLPHNEFNLSAHHQSKDGTLYFGGLGGLITFHPKVFAAEVKSQTPLKFISYYLLENKAEKMTNKTELLFKSDEIIIKPTDKLFELWFTLLDFDAPKHHAYAYKIEGYTNHWNHINENYLRITNLPYGNYVLKIKGQNDSNGWSEQELTLKIRVLKPFYLQWWFITVSLLAGIGIAVSIVRRREFKLQKDRERLETEVQKRTLTILQQAEELKTLDKTKTRFFSNITHEFRTPLTLILGPLEQVISEELPRDTLHRRLNGVLKNARHLLGLINQMLDLSKIENGQMKIEVTRGDIIRYTQELTKRFQSYAQRKGQRLNFIAHQDSWETNFDKDKWDKIVYNLLSNALKFTPAGSAIQLSLVVVQKRAKEFIRLDVKDTGMGIEENHLEQIFNRFYQADGSATRSQDGTGIGLALVKELVELQEGKIRVSSKMDKGTSFSILLPVLKAEQIKTLIHEPATESLTIPFNEENKLVFASKSATCYEQEKLELLIIEDNEEMREYIRNCIDHSIYNISEANNGEEGILKAQSIIPDLIISDVMMPKKDGFEVTQTIRNNISTSHIPLILLTAKSSLESRLKGLQRGADAYLTKPFSPQELTLRIRKLIEIRRLLQQRYKNDTLKIKQDIYQQEDAFITTLRQHVLKHLDESNLNGDRIGKHFGISRVHLHRKLKALTNQSITEFIRSIRLKKAEELILEKQLNISEIAWKTGFSSVSHFSRSFKKSYGKAPSKM